MHLPRRHRRKLLFPPGLLALAGLLWLGCFRIRNHSRLKRYSVLELIVPSVKGEWDANGKPLNFYFTPLQFEKMRDWHTFYLSGSPATDEIVMQQIMKRLPDLHHAADTTQGVKIIFGERSKYADLIKILSSARILNIRRCAFDTRVSPPVFYLLADKEIIYSPDNIMLPY